MVWSPLGGGSINNVEDERNKRINAVAISLQKNIIQLHDKVLLA